MFYLTYLKKGSRNASIDGLTIILLEVLSEFVTSFLLGNIVTLKRIIEASEPLTNYDLF